MILIILILLSMSGVIYSVIKHNWWLLVLSVILIVGCILEYVIYYKLSSVYIDTYIKAIQLGYI